MPEKNGEATIEGFRRDLRVLEREIVRQLQGDTTCCGVTLTQCHALLELAVTDLSLSALASGLNLDSSTVSRTVEAMVQAGWVERSSDPGDRRLNRLSLTPGGRDKVAGINRTCNGYYRALLEKFSPKERLEVIRAVHLLAGHMRGGVTPSDALCPSSTKKSKSSGGEKRGDKDQPATAGSGKAPN